MKKTPIYFLIILQALFASCSNQSTPSKLNITIDPRIELLAAVQSLSDYGEKFSLLTSLDLEYKKDMEQTFKPYADLLRNWPSRFPLQTISSHGLEGRNN